MNGKSATERQPVAFVCASQRFIRVGGGRGPVDPGSARSEQRCTYQTW